MKESDYGCVTVILHVYNKQYTSHCYSTPTCAQCTSHCYSTSTCAQCTCHCYSKSTCAQCICNSIKTISELLNYAIFLKIAITAAKL